MVNNRLQEAAHLIKHSSHNNSGFIANKDISNAQSLCHKILKESFYKNLQHHIDYCSGGPLSFKAVIESSLSTVINTVNSKEEIIKFKEECLFIANLLKQGVDHSKEIDSLADLYKAKLVSLVLDKLKVSELPEFIVKDELDEIRAEVNSRISEYIKADFLRYEYLTLNDEYSQIEIFLRLMDNSSENNIDIGKEQHEQLMESQSEQQSNILNSKQLSTNIKPLDESIVISDQIKNLVLEIFICSSLPDIAGSHTVKTVFEYRTLKKINKSCIFKDVNPVELYCELLNEYQHHLTALLKSQSLTSDEQIIQLDYFDNKIKSLGNKIFSEFSTNLKPYKDRILRFILLSLYYLLYDHRENNSIERKFFLNFIDSLSLWEDPNLLSHRVLLIELLFENYNNIHSHSSNSNYNKSNKHNSYNGQDRKHSARSTICYTEIEKNILNSCAEAEYKENIIKKTELKKEEPKSSSKIAEGLFQFGKGLVKNLAGKDLFEHSNSKEVSLNPELITLSPYNKYKDFFPTVTILVSGFLSQSNNQKDLWKNVLSTMTSSYTDFYTLSWQSSSVSDFGVNLLSYTTGSLIKLYFSRGGKNVDYDWDKYLSENNEFVVAMKRSEIIGKLLAYTIASKKQFKGKLVNLIGFSLGCNVIKSCLDELSRLTIPSVVNNNKGYKVSSNKTVINNVMFVGGATTIDLNKKSEFNSIEICGGRLINVFSSCDLVLEELYTMVVKKTAVGVQKLEIDNNRIIQDNTAKLDMKEETTVKLDNKQEAVNPNSKDLDLLDQEEYWKYKVFYDRRIENYNYSNEYIGHTDYRGIMDKVFERT
eukprot:CAMPEP_0170514962 /NCGR_PEP_ID=MMETSP0209-20121228/1455_1 /TAXON_ID=665100 ORGANISM="Litonotus pictus, Strain P1" /NCGR_SAMPLE_ID=MMETSP0209 /ASSEMBLY_ACC=CAM_ASM_000301 /LENGTH=818 /DNA_ID=CAMNT_0010799239 /DNA_START=237 /DNA_END=2689 /DNA_ORIENTATION=+